jgi:hypothetical protein
MGMFTKPKLMLPFQVDLMAFYAELEAFVRPLAF